MYLFDDGVDLVVSGSGSKNLIRTSELHPDEQISSGRVLMKLMYEDNNLSGGSAC